MTVNISFAGLKAWLISKNWTAHSVAVLAIGAATAITTDEQVRSLLVGIFANHPKISTGILTAAGIILKYSHSSSQAGTVATAENIMSAPNPPAPAAIAAANPLSQPAGLAQPKQGA